MKTVNTFSFSHSRSFPVILFALTLLAGNIVSAATITSQTTGGNWSDPATWIGGVVPVAGDSVVIPATNATPVICDINAACASLSVSPNCQINIADSVILTATGTPIINGTSLAAGTIATGAGGSRFVLAGTTNQFLSGIGTYGNLEISNILGYVRTPTTATMTIASGCTLTVDSRALLQQGSSSQPVVGNGNFVLADGAALGIRDVGGISATSGETNGFIRLTGLRIFSTNANYIYNGTAPQFTGTGLPATVNSLTISNPAGVAATTNLAVSGATTISAGTLALGPTATLTVGASLNLAAGATFDVSALGASATYTLNNAILTASGTGITNGVSAAAINGGASGTVSLGSLPINLTYDGFHPALYVSQGTLSLNRNTFTVNTTNGASLAAGTYAIVQQAGGNIASNGTFTVSGTAIGTGMSGSIQVSGTKVNLIIAPLQLAIASVNGGVSPIVGTSFSVVVQAQGAGGVPINVVTDTAVTLGRTSGTGTLGGTTNGTILAGTSSVTISGVTYTKAETNVVLTATRISGDALASGNSAAFSVSAGAAATLTLTSGNSQSGLGLAALASPFVVTTTDAGGNPVGGTSVTFSIVDGARQCNGPIVERDQHNDRRKWPGFEHPDTG
jgi:hypothetical protein